MPGIERVFLLGLMGAGKSTVGGALAGLLGWPYLDNDLLLRRRTGIDTVGLAALGRGALHLQESRQLHALLDVAPPYVAGIAASVAERPDDLAVLRAAGLAVYLRARPATLAGRIGPGEGRPWLDAEPRVVLGRMFRTRDATLRLADLVVDTDERDPADVAAGIAPLLARGAGD